MWTSENRPRYNRDQLRYPSDLTDEEWAHIEPYIPPGKRGGGKRRVNMREVVNGVMYVSGYNRIDALDGDEDRAGASAATADHVAYVHQTKPGPAVDG